MKASEIIARKRDGQELSAEEIGWFVRGCVSGEVPDYQAAAWLMATYLNGMSQPETVALTRAMAESGRALDLGDLRPRAVDKHSSGGVGDKISLVVGPIAAAAGVVVPKMSGRGLGFTGGTLDKLESIPGLRVDLEVDRILDQARQIGLVIASQTADLAPADGKLYALRDVTATVGSLPLIVSSILSKKIAGGAPSIVLDVKAGSGAFMRTTDEAVKLARALVDVGTACDRRVVAFVSRMDQPLGRAVGNAVEVREAIEILQGNGPDDVRELALTLAAAMVRLGGLASDEPEARRRVDACLASGAALVKLRQMISAQGGDARVVDDPSLLRTAPLTEVVKSPRAGYVERLDAGIVGSTLTGLGAGREKKGDAIDHRIGIMFHRKIGDKVATDEPLFTLHLASAARLPEARGRILAAYAWSDRPVESPSILIQKFGAR